MQYNGEIQLIIGPMYSGKTTELLRLYKRYYLAGKKCILIKHNDDIRYESNYVVTHDQKKYKAISTKYLEDILNNKDVTSSEVICIDEIQFFIDAASICDKWANDGKIVIASSIHTGLQHVDFALTRFLSDGTLDSSFATNGSLITNMAMSEMPRDMVFQPDGKLVVSGSIFYCLTCPAKNITYRFDNLNAISGLDHIQETNPIRIYPNPASNYFKIDFSGRISQVELYNVGGQQIIAAKNSKIIDVSRIASGLYFYKITNDEGKLYLGKLLVE